MDAWADGRVSFTTGNNFQETNILLMDQKSGDHQLRLVVHPVIYQVLYIPSGAGFPSIYSISIPPNGKRRIIFLKSAGWEGICDRSQDGLLFVEFQNLLLYQSESYSYPFLSLRRYKGVVTHTLILSRYHPLTLI